MISYSNGLTLTSGISKSTRKHSSRACLECRRRHTKCDGKTVCTNCTVNKRQCQYVSSKRGGFRVPKSIANGNYTNNNHQNDTSSISSNGSTCTSKDGTNKSSFSKNPTDLLHQLPTPTGQSPPDDINETPWQRLIRIYYEYFYKNHPIFPINTLEKLTNRDGADSVLEFLAMVATGENQLNIEATRQSAIKMKDRIYECPNDLVKFQSLILGSIGCHMSLCQDTAKEMRDKAIDMVVHNNVRSGRAPDMSAYADTVHELYALDVMMCAASSCRRSVLPNSGVMMTMSPPSTEGTLIRYHVVNMIDRVIQGNQPEKYFRNVIDQWDEVLQDRYPTGDANIAFAYMCVNYCLIMMDLPKSTLCQPQYPAYLTCDSNDPTMNDLREETKDCSGEGSRGNSEVVIGSNGKNASGMTIEDPDLLKSRTRVCIRAANNIVRLAMFMENPSPLVSCGVGMAYLILIKAYDYLSSESSIDDLARKMELANVESSVLRSSQILDSIGRMWPLSTYLNHKLRNLILQNLPDLYPNTVGASIPAGIDNVLNNLTLSGACHGSTSTAGMSSEADGSGDDHSNGVQTPGEPVNLASVGMDFLQMLEFL